MYRSLSNALDYYLLILVFLASLAVSASGYVVWDIVAVHESTLNAPIPAEVDSASIEDLAVYAERYVQDWQESLYLNSLAARFHIVELHTDSKLIPTGHSSFSFAGWRRDWLQSPAELLGYAHLLARIEMDTERRVITHFSHSQGKGFGYNAPLDIADWPLYPTSLLNLCDQHGAHGFRIIHTISDVGLYAVSTRAGRQIEMTLGNNPSNTFNCIANLDTGEVSVRQGEQPWRSVANFLE